MKNRVLQFFLLLGLLVVLLTVLHFLRFGNLTGFAVLSGGEPPIVFSNGIEERSISTEGYENINFSYDRTLDNVIGFNVSWNNGTGWTVIEPTIGGDDSDSKQFSLDSRADNNANFKIRFECESVNGNCSIDNILVEGQEIVAPSVSIGSPQEGEVFESNESLPLSFSNTTSLDSCWYSLDGGNSTVSIADCESTIFDVSSDGEYELVLYANSSGEIVSDSVNFMVVVEGVILEISQPKGTKDSLTGISVEFNAYGNDLSCSYSVEWADGGSVSGTGGDIANCQNFNFDVPDNGDYVFKLSAENSFGVVESISSEFSVNAPDDSGDSSSSEDSDSDGESGSTITGAVVSEESINLQFSELGEVSARGGEVNTMNIEVENADTRTLNGCVLLSEGALATWVKSLVRGFEPGEKSNYEFLLSVPEDTEPGVYSGNLVVECTEGRAEKEIQVSVSSDSFGVEILDYERIGNTLRVNYTLEEFAGAAHELILVYELVDLDDVVRTTGQEELVLGVGNKINNVLEFDLPKDSFGEFDFRIILDDGASVVATNTPVLLSSEGVTGLAVSDTNRRALSILGIIVILGVAIFFAWRYYPTWGPEVKNFFGSKFGKNRKSESSFVKLGF